ncbi:MAG: cell division ATP-binding protein FtsE [Bacteroidales bacterium]|jgi:cell division transport system ATP-binding protein|nr:ATP-binding cassette domain-containing protein [Bacteroidales bacterium]
MSPIIEFKNLDVYQKNILVLSGIDLSIDKGEFVYFTGKTGTGKSSLVKVMYADLPAQGDKAQVAGIDLLKLKNKNIPTLRRKLGIVFQDFQLLYDRSVHDNLVFVMKATGWKDKNKMQERINEVLAMTGLGTKGFKMPHQLSGGEQQRVCIARALINEPEIILADEPTGNLDPETSVEIMEVLHNVVNKEGRTVVMITHDYMMLEKYPSRTIRFQNGGVEDSEQKETENIAENQIIEDEIDVVEENMETEIDTQVFEENIAEQDNFEDDEIIENESIESSSEETTYITEEDELPGLYDDEAFEEDLPEEGIVQESAEIFEEEIDDIVEDNHEDEDEEEENSDNPLDFIQEQDIFDFGDDEK